MGPSAPGPAPAYDAIVVGAGAAGMMCAAQAGQRGLRVLLVEHYHRLGEKIRISGGGRCNFTNLGASPANYLSSNPHFCRSALARYTPQDFVALVERHGIAYHEKKLGQLFCDGPSQAIIDMLAKECADGGVTWRMPCRVERVTRTNDGYALATDQGPYEARSLVIATGGLSVPKIGATPLGYRIAEQFGIAVVPPRPGLVPLAFAPDFLEAPGELAGVSIDARISCNGGSFRENLLFTHRGLSGPAILQISSYWNPGDPISIDLLPDRDAAQWLQSERSGASHLGTVLSAALPRRFVKHWLSGADYDRPMRQFAPEPLRAIGTGLQDWRVIPSGTLGYQKAEVTLGGVDTRELSSKTLEAIAVPGLYFIGEVVDVTGQLGGYNFQWAWASAHAAARALR